MVRAADRVLERPEPEPGLGEEPAVLDEEPLQEAGAGLVQADVQSEPAHRTSRVGGAGRLRHAKSGRAMHVNSYSMRGGHYAVREWTRGAASTFSLPHPA